MRYSCPMMTTTSKLSERLVLMVSPEQKQQLQDQAEKSGLGVGEYVRSVLFPDVAPASVEILQQQLDALRDRMDALEVQIMKKEIK